LAAANDWSSCSGFFINLDNLIFWNIESWLNDKFIIFWRKSYFRCIHNLCRSDNSSPKLILYGPPSSGNYGVSSSLPFNSTPLLPIWTSRDIVQYCSSFGIDMDKVIYMIRVIWKCGLFCGFKRILKI
jgi:hypothetical protein